MSPGPRIGDLYLSGEEISARVAELGAEIAADYAAGQLLLVGLLKGSFVFLADLSRELPTGHAIDFVELAAFGGGEVGGHSRVRLVKDLDSEIADRDVLLVEDIVDTGLTLNYLRSVLRLRSPRSLAIATLLDRPYRRLVDDLPVRYTGFVVPDEFFVGYGFDIAERYRNLPGLHVAKV